MNIELTNDEANELIKLMDAGVRQSGLQSAAIASTMLAKLQAAAAEPTPAPEEPDNGPD